MAFGLIALEEIKSYFERKGVIKRTLDNIEFYIEKEPEYAGKLIKFLNSYMVDNLTSPKKDFIRLKNLEKVLDSY
jgi:hypothetical protein